MRKWIDDENLWVRRAAIIAQLKHKKDTDEQMLFEFCLRRAEEPDFFIRKAIGWSLRQYAWTNPDAVKKFLKSHGKKLPTLAVREAGKNIGVKP
jgi:3-methyladenine DNA glycosylase AlkD